MEKQADDTSYPVASEAAQKPHSEKTASISSVSHQLDDLRHAGLVAPTEEEMKTLRHVPDKINWSAYSRPSSIFFLLVSLKRLHSDRLYRAGGTLLRKSRVCEPPFHLLIASSQYYGKSYPISFPSPRTLCAYHFTFKAVP
jgi:hypothetical protein